MIDGPSDSLPVSSNLVDLSRNASVISTSSSSSSSSLLPQPIRAIRPLRPFSAPRRSQSRDPQSPSTPRNSSRPPAFLTKDLALALDPSPSDPPPLRLSQSRSRQNSVGGKFSINDFSIDRNPLGEGSYSEVLRGTHLITRKTYAIKVVDKKLLMREGKVNTAHAEKNALNKLGGKSHPGIIRLHWTFQDDWSLYFVLDLAPNGDLQSYISRLGSLSPGCSRYYTAQILDALQWMHGKGVLHRDLKPENVLLDSDMRVKITDFGTSKSFDESDQEFRATTWVGTAQYIAPELIIDTYTTKSSDIWAWGCLLYQCISGKFPFVAPTQYLMWEKVKKLEYSFPDGFEDQARDLVERILILNPMERLGAGPEGSLFSPKSLKSHIFFSVIDWDSLWTIPAPPMTAGIYVRPPKSEEEAAFDAGAAWDALASGDGIPWVNGDRAVPFELTQVRLHPDEIAPHEIPRDMTFVNGNASTDRELSKESGDSSSSARSRRSNSLSRSSSSDRTGSVAEDVNVTRVDSRSKIIDPWLAALGPTETMILSSPVIPRTTLRQRASSILPAVSPIKLPPPRVKRRQLILTSERLLCLKLKDGRPPSIKAEIPLTSKRLSVEKKGEKEFNVIVSGKPYTYSVEDEALANRWMRQINETMEDHRGRRQTRS